MKKILFTLLFIPLLSLGQNQEIVELRNEIDLIKENLDSHHKQFKNGIIISMAGLSATIAGGLIALPPIVIIGSITSLIGTVIMLNSDKWFGEKFMNSSKKKGVYKLEREQKTQIFAGDEVEIVTPFKIINGTFISHGKEI